MKDRWRAIVAALLAVAGLALSACATSQAPPAEKQAARGKAEGAGMQRADRRLTAGRSQAQVPCLPAQAEKGRTRQVIYSLSEAELFGLLHVTNLNDIEGGRVAEDLAMNPQVKAFAGRMAAEHSMMLEEGDALAERLHITPWLPPPARTLALRHEAMMQTLKSQSGIGFDRAYLDHEITVHRTMMESMEGVDETHHPELKKILRQALPALHTHLTAAQDLREILNPLPPSAGRGFGTFQKVGPADTGTLCNQEKLTRKSGTPREP